MNPINTNSIRNIIFDLGGVILNIDYHKTEQAFINLGIADFKELYSQFHANSFFKDFEKGKIDPQLFVSQLKTYASDLSEQDIITAWNAMLLDFPPGRIEFLLKLKNHYRTFLLSNTNAIHHQAFQKIELDTAGTLDTCFEKVYYSHEMGLRKPDKEIFEFVLNENKLVARETLFLDDTLANVEAARSVNLQAIYITSSERIEDILFEFVE
jgi:epoxide hydrolase-like predicted phosphatase